MRLFGKSTKDINKMDIDRLINNQVAESLTLDYKAELSISNDNGKKELLKDVSAMANAYGGFLIFGVKEAKEDGKNAGYPEEVTSLNASGSKMNIEQLRQSLEQIIRDGLEPRISGIEFKDIQYDDERTVFIIEVPRSLYAPHMVTFKNQGKFYSRANTGNFQMDVRQIRDAMLRVSDWINKAELIRVQRISQLKNRVFNNDRYKGSLVFHLVPLGERQNIDLRGKRELFHSNVPAMIEKDGYDHIETIYNIEGIKKYSSIGTTDHYQLFRNGVIEGFQELDYEVEDGGYKWEIDLRNITYRIMDLTRHFMNLANSLELTPPFIIYISLLKTAYAYVKLNGGRKQSLDEEHPEYIDFPGVMIEENNVNIAEVLRPTLDMLYQAGGFEECPLYDANGQLQLENKASF